MGHQFYLTVSRFEEIGGVRRGSVSSNVEYGLAFATRARADSSVLPRARPAPCVGKTTHSCETEAVALEQQQDQGLG